MHIGMILDTPYPSDNRVYQEAAALQGAGHKLSLFSLGLLPGRPTVEQLAPFTVYRYASTPLIYKSSAIAYPWPLYKYLLKPKLKHFLDTVKPELIHVHDMVIAEAVMEVVKGRVPVVLDLHENRPTIMQYYPHMRKPLSRLLIKKAQWERAQIRLMRRADYVVVVTEEARQQALKDSGRVADKIVVVPNTISIPEDRLPQKGFEKNIPDELNILYIGDTGVRRGLLTAIEGLRILKDKGFRLKLTVVGSSSEDSRLREAIAAAGVEEEVKMMGWQAPDRLPDFLSQAHVGISPLYRNLHHDTTFANKLFQYMAAGIPLLVSDSTAQANLVRKEACGLVHEAENAADFADKLERLCRDKELMRKMGFRAYQALKDHYCPEKAMQGLLDLYQRLEQVQH